MSKINKHTGMIIRHTGVRVFVVCSVALVDELIIHASLHTCLASNSILALVWKISILADNSHDNLFVTLVLFIKLELDHMFTGYPLGLKPS